MIFDSNWNELDSYDEDKGYVLTQEQPLFAAYIVEDEGEGDYEVVKEYDNGGKDVEWRWTRKPVGAWHFADGDGTEWAHPPKPPIEDSWDKAQVYACVATWDLYHDYTADELAQHEQEKLEAEEAQERQELINALPDAVVELGDLAADNSANVDQLTEAIFELAQIVSDLTEGTEDNG